MTGRWRQCWPSVIPNSVTACSSLHGWDGGDSLTGNILWDHLMKTGNELHGYSASLPVTLIRMDLIRLKRRMTLNWEEPGSGLCVRACNELGEARCWLGMHLLILNLCCFRLKALLQKHIRQRE